MEDVLVARASFAQDWMWMLQQMEEGAPIYNVQMGLRFRGEFQETILRDALDRVVARHEILRTTLDLQDGELMQFIAPPDAVPLSLVDADAEERVEEVSRTELARTFDTSTEAPLRAVLVRRTPTDHVLFITLDHLVADAVSLRLLHTELATLYAAAHTGTDANLPEPRIQYADYADWQREWFDGPEPARQIAYWRERLTGATPISSAPLIGERALASLTRPLPGELLASLDRIARTSGVPVFTVLLAAYSLMLASGAGREDLVVGTVMNGRTRTELESLVGFFVNTVAVRTDLSGQPTFRALLDRVAAVNLEAYENQDVPYDRLVAELNPPRVAGRLPYFDVMFQLIDVDRAPVRLPGLDIERQEIVAETAPVDLIVAVLRDGAEHLGVWSYDANVYPTALVESMLDRYERLLTAIVADPDRTVWELVGRDGTWLLDRDAARSSTSDGAATSSTSALEASIGAVWAEILQRGQVDGTDDFFDLGGHSLAATRMVIRLRAELGFALPVRVIFDNPVLGDFAAAVEERAAKARR